MIPDTPETLKAFREALGMSRADVARECGVSVRTVTRWEDGTTRVTWKKAYPLALLVSSR